MLSAWRVSIIEPKGAPHVSQSGWDNMRGAPRKQLATRATGAKIIASPSTIDPLDESLLTLRCFSGWQERRPAPSILQQPMCCALKDRVMTNVFRPAHEQCCRHQSTS
jgi:hypothetical protein